MFLPRSRDGAAATVCRVIRLLCVLHTLTPSFFPQHQSLAACGDYRNASVKALVELKHLTLSSCDRITNVGLAHLAALAQLQHLNLSHCRKITDAGLYTLPHSCSCSTWTSLGAISSMAAATLRLVVRVGEW